MTINEPNLSKSFVRMYFRNYYYLSQTKIKNYLQGQFLVKHIEVMLTYSYLYSIQNSVPTIFNKL